MGIFGRDYDRDYDREFWDRDRPDYRGYAPGMYGGPMRPAPTPREGGWSRGEWGRDMRYGGEFARGGYDHAYKSRWQTDFGDPYSDRLRHTPVRIVPGEFRGYGRDYERPAGPREYRGFGGAAGYDPDYGPPPPAYRNRDRDRDNGWF